MKARQAAPERFGRHAHGRNNSDHVVKRFGAVEVIRDVSLTVADGEFVVFVGPSGCGKSSLLRLITGFLEDLTGGRVLIDGADMSRRAPRSGGLPWFSSLMPSFRI